MKNNEQLSPRLLIAPSIKAKDNISVSAEDKSMDFPQFVKELPLTFFGRGEVRGRKFTQIKRSDLAYLYQINLNGVIYYEVFKRRQNHLFGNITYPSSHAFGRWAWTTFSIERALQIFITINQEGGR